MVGSVFSPSANQVDAEARTPSFAPGELSQHREARERTPEQNVQIPQPAPLIPHHPLLPPLRRIQASNEGTPTPSPPKKIDTPGSVTPDLESVRPAPVAQKQGASQQPAYEPLMRVDAVRSEPKIIQQAGSSRRDTGRQEAVRREEREADDIQIHIGRIEVLAVPPAPPVARPASAAQKPSSLDDYLQRRDRRTL